MSDTVSMLPSMRWSILRTLHVGGHQGATEEMLRVVLTAEYLNATRDFIRDQLEYLRQRKLVDLQKSEVNPWRGTLTRYGYDVCEYQVDVEPGIDRPPRTAE